MKTGTLSYLYRLYSADGSLLYVGITNNIGRRFEEHSERKPWWGEVRRKVIVTCPTREWALIAERSAIKAELPAYNVVHAGSLMEYGDHGWGYAEDPFIRHTIGKCRTWSGMPWYLRELFIWCDALRVRGRVSAAIPYRDGIRIEPADADTSDPEGATL